MSETVDNEIRDEVMANILAKPPNQVCFDCGSKAPKWSSPYLGIVICYECAAKHRSYGTHISFVRSVDLDKWNRKQLKSLELTGNSFTKERFNDLGVPLIGGNYDYNNSMVLKVRQEIAEKVRESLKPDDYKKVEDKKKEVDEFENININNEEIKDEEKEKEKKKEKNDKKKKKEKNEEKVEEKNEEIEEKEEIKKPQKFEVDKKAKVENAKVIGKAGKINRIKKMDFNFDFDSFNDVNFSDFTKKDEDNDKEKKEDDEKKDEDEQKEKEHEKEKEKESENEGYQKSYGKKISKKELKNKFANKKAISSEDYAALEEGNSDNKIVKDRIKSMGNSQAISSEDVFGSNGESNVYEGESMTDKLKDMALNFTLSAAEKAKALKNKTNEFINKVQNKFSGGGY
jgi:hypothetical protein